MSRNEDMSEDPKIPKHINFLFGGLAGMAGCVIVQPMDLIKNRMQLSGMVSAKKEFNTLYGVLKSVVKNEGVLALYSGLSAGLLRQATYTTARLGTYSILYDTFSTPSVPPNFSTKAVMGMAAGVVGSFFGSPSEVALIRMTSDGLLPSAERRNYKSVVDAIIRIAREEGILALWRGATPTFGKAMVVNTAQLATYSQAKETLLARGYFDDNIGLHLAASMISCLITTIASMPQDIVKTRIQSMKIVDGKPVYTGTLDVLGNILKKEGVLALWKGFTPYYARVGPHTVLLFIFFEQFISLYKTHVLGIQ